MQHAEDDDHHHAERRELGEVALWYSSQILIDTTSLPGE